MGKFRGQQIALLPRRERYNALGVNAVMYLLVPRSRNSAHNPISAVSDPPIQGLEGLAVKKISGQCGGPQADWLNAS